MASTHKNRITPQFTGRKEYFGSVFFDRALHRVLPFDHLGTALLEALCDYTLPQAVSAFKRSLDAGAIERFARTWRDEGLLDESNRCRGVFLPDRSCDGFLSGPLRVYIDFTAGCNLRCRHCVSSSEKPLERELSTDEYREVLRIMAGDGVFELNVGGGEPLFRKDALELLHDAVAMGFSTGITTNTTLVDDATARALAAIDLRYIAVSLDGASPETHDYIRGKGAFDKVVRKIALLARRTNHHLNLHFTLMRHNLGELERFFALTEELPVHSLGIVNLRPQGRARENRELFLSQDDYRLALHRMQLLAARATKAAFLIPFMPGIDEDGPSRLYPGFGCGAAQVTCHMDASGALSPCNYLERREPQELVLEKGVLAVWRENPHFKALRSPAVNAQCLSCRHFQDCRGGCRAQAEYFHGSLDAPDYYCMGEAPAAA